MKETFTYYIILMAVLCFVHLFIVILNYIYGNY